MAIEDIFRALEEQAEEDCKTILGSAKAQAESIAEDAERQAEETVARAVELAVAAIEAESSHKVNAAKLMGKKEIASLKGRAIDEVFAAASEELGSIRKDAGYPDLLAGLTDEAIAGVDDEYVVIVDPADEAVMRDIQSRKGFEAKIDTSIAMAGGLIVTTRSGRVSRLNTIESRLDKLRHMAQSQVAEILFG